jgi:multiple sugar transport system permease protein
VKANVIAAPAVQARPSFLRRRRGARREGWVAVVFLLPSFLGFLVFYVVPSIKALYVSFTDYSFYSPPGAILGRPGGHWVGGQNYQALVHDPLFWNALRVTGEYVVINIAAQTTLALILAVLMDRLTKSAAVRGILILPWLIPNVMVALVFQWIVDHDLGVLNGMLGSLGFAHLGFLDSSSQAIPTIALINTWRNTGYTALLLFAGLQMIPKTLYEAAAIDGANELKLFTRVTLPLLRPVLALVLIVSIIGSFQVFDTIVVSENPIGGPVNATRVIYVWIYQNAWQFGKVGYASAMAVVLAGILLVITLAQMRLLRASESDLSAP